LPDVLSDGVAMERAEPECLEHHHLQSAGEKAALFLVCHLIYALSVYA
jgi:hypothetical protein